jgi:hypothetical protein
MDSGFLRAPGDALLLDLARTAVEAGRYLPVDAFEQGTTAAEALLSKVPGPRALVYGPARNWAAEVVLEDGRRLEIGAPDPVEAGKTTDVDQDSGILAALSTAQIAHITWRSLPLPPAARTVLGAFGNLAALERALDKLDAERPEALVAVELCDRVVARWLCGVDPGQPFNLLLRVEGEQEPAALASRKAWQSVELAGGQPTTVNRAGGRWVWGPVHPAGGPPMARLRMEAARVEIPRLFDAALSTAGVLGRSAARAHPLLGLVYAYLPAGPRLDEAIAWLDEQAVAVGGESRLERRPADLP